VSLQDFIESTQDAFEILGCAYLMELFFLFSPVAMISGGHREKFWQEFFSVLCSGGITGWRREWKVSLCDSHIRRHDRDSDNYWKPAWVETEMAAMAPGAWRMLGGGLTRCPHMIWSLGLP
jgi:hypothetical protein